MSWISRTAICLLCSLGLVLAGTASAAPAGVVDSATLLSMEQRAETVEAITNALEREELAEQLQAMGVDPTQVQARIGQLTDEELTLLHTRMAELPAGGSDVLVALGIIFVILVLLEALNITNIVGVR